MKTSSIFITVLLIIAFVFSSCGKKPVTTDTKNKTDSVKKEISKDVTTDKSAPGVDTFITAGYMYWVPPAIIDTTWSAVVLGEVLSIEKRKSTGTDPNKAEVFGMVKINKILYSVPAGDKNMEGQKYIRTDALKGFKQGDKVLIYFVRYEKGYAIKRGNVHKVSGPEDELVGMTERFLQSGQNTEYILNDPKEYRLWGKYDKGTASRLMQDYEEKQKGK